MLRKGKGPVATIRPSSLARARLRARHDGPTRPMAEGACARQWLCRKAPELLDNNMTTIRTIPNDNGFANKPSNVSTFTTGRSLGIPTLIGVAANGIG